MSAVPAPSIEPRPDSQASPPSPVPVGDGDLMRRFISGADAGAFEGLVRRHGPMVFGVCRRMLRDRHDAEDAFQATFLVLLKKAGSVRPPERVGRWLYGVACRTAAKANTMKLRRRKKENEVPPPLDTHSPADQSELRSLLDVELARMPERYRAPIVLCELDGLSRREAAAALQVAEGTLSSRLSRARDLLRARLTRRGLTLSAGALVARLTAESASASAAMPAALLESAARGMTGPSSIGPSGLLGSSPDNVIALAKGVIKSMWIAKLQTVALTTLMLGTLGTGAGVVTHHVIVREKEAAVAKAKKDGQKAPASPTVSTTIEAIDTTAGTITANLPTSGKKGAPVTLKLAPEVAVELAGIGKGAPATPGTLADVTPGVNVNLRLTDDKATVTHIVVVGEHINGTVKSIDAAAHTITVVKQNKSGEVEKTLPLHADARISFAGGGKNKLEAVPAAAFSDLAVGVHVSASISADRKVFTSITIEGKSVSGSVAAVDPAKHSISVTNKGEDDQSFTVAPDAAVYVGQGEQQHAGTLADVTAGMSVNAQTFSRDPKVVMSLHAWAQEKSIKSEK